MSCDNCKILEKRLEQMRLENLEMEERRSRERVRLATLEDNQFAMRLSGNDKEPGSNKQMVSDLVELVKHVVENPNRENLSLVKEQLGKFMI